MALSILTVIALTQLDARNFGNGVGLIGGLQCAGEQGIFAHGLGCQFGIDATGTEEHELANAAPECGIDDICAI